MTSIHVPKTIWRHIVEEAERRATSPETVMVELLLRIVPEEKWWEALREAAEEALEHAKEHASRGEYGEALQRLWASTLLALRAQAVRVGRSVERMLDYLEVALELGATAVDAFTAAFTGNTVAELNAGRDVLEKMYNYCLDKAEKLVKEIGVEHPH